MPWEAGVAAASVVLAVAAIVAPLLRAPASGTVAVPDPPRSECTCVCRFEGNTPAPLEAWVFACFAISSLWFFVLGLLCSYCAKSGGPQPALDTAGGRGGKGHWKGGQFSLGN